MCVLRDYFSAIIGQLLNHHPRSIHEATSFKSFKISLLQDIFFMSNFAKGNNSEIAKGNNRKIKLHFFKSSLGYLLIILYQLFKFVQSS